jgi:hypothetical protein
MLNNIYPFSKIIDIEPEISMNKVNISKVPYLFPEIRNDVQLKEKQEVSVMNHMATDGLKSEN